jgi:hypothetical protein
VVILAMTVKDKEYIAGQRSRYQKALDDNDNDLITRLQADAKRVGYDFNGISKTVKPTAPSATTSTATTTATKPTVAPVIPDKVNMTSLVQNLPDTSALKQQVLADQLKTPVQDKKTEVQPYANVMKPQTTTQLSTDTNLFGSTPIKTETKDDLINKAVSNGMGIVESKNNTNSTVSGGVSSASNSVQVSNPSNNQTPSKTPYTPSNEGLINFDKPTDQLTKDIEAENKRKADEEAKKKALMDQLNSTPIESLNMDNTTRLPGQNETDRKAAEQAQEIAKQVLQSTNKADDLQLGLGPVNTEVVRDLADGTRSMTPDNRLTPKPIEPSRAEQFVNQLIDQRNKEQEPRVTTPAMREQDQFTFDASADPLVKALTNMRYDAPKQAEALPTQSFNYDVTADPLYKAQLENALKAAGLNARDASRAAMEVMNERGLLNSSLTANQLAQIQQDAITRAQADLQASLVPQLTQQAYQRYRDTIGDQQANVARQDQLNNLDYQRFRDQVGDQRFAAELSNALRGQAFGEYQAGLDQDTKQQQLAMQLAGLTGNFGGQRTLEATNADRDYNVRLGALLGLVDGKKTLDSVQADRNYELAKADNERQAKQLALQLELDWAQLDEAKKENLREQAYRNATLNEQIRSNKADETMDRIKEASGSSGSSTKSQDVTSEYNTLLKTPFIRERIDPKTGEAIKYVYDKTGLSKAIMQLTIPNESKVSLFSLFNVSPPQELSAPLTNDVMTNDQLKQALNKYLK